jgi:hypothetical protein
MMRRLIASAAIVAALLFGAQAPSPAAAQPPAAVAAQAQVAMASSDCYANTICLFAYGNFTNPIWRQYADQINGCRSLVGTGWNDVTSHAWNRAGGTVVTLYWNADCTGASFNNLTGGAWDNELSAIRVTLL